MRSYHNIDELWLGVLDDLLNGDEAAALESRVGGCREIVGWSGKLLRPDFNFLVNPERKLSATYAAGELLWYLAGRQEIDGIVAYAPRYKEFAPNGKAEGAYGYRWGWNPGFVNADHGEKYTNQLDALLRLLTDQPNTRQAVVTCWDSKDLIRAIDGTAKDLPCTVALQFLVRDRQVHLCVYMRSNDAWLGLPYDVFCFTTIQQLVATALGMHVGTYTHSVGSMHLYDRNIAQAGMCLITQDSYHPQQLSSEAENVTQEEAIEALTHEEWSRWCQLEKDGRLGVRAPDGDMPRWTTMMDDLVACCWHKTVNGFDARSKVRRAELREALR